jgi:hypothetical protein
MVKVLLEYGATSTFETLLYFVLKETDISMVTLLVTSPGGEACFSDQRQMEVLVAAMCSKISISTVEITEQMTQTYELVELSFNRLVSREQTVQVAKSIDTNNKLILELLIKRGADVPKLDSLHKAVAANNAPHIKKLLSQTGRQAVKDSRESRSNNRSWTAEGFSTDGYTYDADTCYPLHLATSGCVASILLKHGHDPMDEDSNGNSCLAHAMETDRFDVLKTLWSSKYLPEETLIQHFTTDVFRKLIAQCKHALKHELLVLVLKRLRRSSKLKEVEFMFIQSVQGINRECVSLLTFYIQMVPTPDITVVSLMLECGAFGSMKFSETTMTLSSFFLAVKLVVRCSVFFCDQVSLEDTIACHNCWLEASICMIQKHASRVSTR